MTKEKLDIYDKLLAISTAINLGYLKESQLPRLVEYLKDKVCDHITDNFSEMSYRELYATLMHCSHRKIDDWGLSDLCEELIEYYSNWAQSEDEIAENDDLQEIDKLIHESITPIEWTKLIGKLEEQGTKYYYY